MWSGNITPTFLIRAQLSRFWMGKRLHHKTYHKNPSVCTISNSRFNCHSYSGHLLAGYIDPIETPNTLKEPLHAVTVYVPYIPRYNIPKLTITEINNNDLVKSNKETMDISKQ